MAPTEAHRAVSNVTVPLAAGRREWLGLAVLTLPAMIAMNKAFYVDKQSAAAIAKAFLKANHLI